MSRNTKYLPQAISAIPNIETIDTPFWTLQDRVDGSPCLGDPVVWGGLHNRGVSYPYKCAENTGPNAYEQDLLVAVFSPRPTSRTSRYPELAKPDPLN